MAINQIIQIHLIHLHSCQNKDALSPLKAILLVSLEHVGFLANYGVFCSAFSRPKIQEKNNKSWWHVEQILIIIGNYRICTQFPDKIWIQGSLLNIRSIGYCIFPHWFHICEATERARRKQMIATHWRAASTPTLQEKKVLEVWHTT